MNREYEQHILLNHIRAASKTVDDDWQRNAKSIGLTAAEQHILWIVHSYESLSVTDIADIGLWDRSTVMQVLKRMQGKDLIEMQKDHYDRRRSFVYLTDAGKQKRVESSQFEFEMYTFMKKYFEDKKELLEGMNDFFKAANTHFHGKSFINWLEHSKESDMFKDKKE
ncbi:MarR family winged helix-turn-helix transcriptional regulator [Salisediminibacterium beveridgei]|uniref:HTH-type transcriptional regulator hpr n=1 Tax=Salisediminibacterium beveridgei TaxID=632773 RepID=A0A1D7QUJ6_9BACI|nr:MarR family winged helix-turn-helix transcriptional regulator [Salisediminibacterium beveridgei]AOM82696.1 HTH-type transcriptional regulator hpr [Salisediminibacterium beveridgei]